MEYECNALDIYMYEFIMGKDKKKIMEYLFLYENELCAIYFFFSLLSSLNICDFYRQ